MQDAVRANDLRVMSSTRKTYIGDRQSRGAIIAPDETPARAHRASDSGNTIALGPRPRRAPCRRLLLRLVLDRFLWPGQDERPADRAVFVERPGYDRAARRAGQIGGHRRARAVMVRAERRREQPDRIELPGAARHRGAGWNARCRRCRNGKPVLRHARRRAGGTGDAARDTRTTSGLPQGRRQAGDLLLVQHALRRRGLAGDPRRGRSEPRLDLDRRGYQHGLPARVRRAAPVQHRLVGQPAGDAQLVGRQSALQGGEPRRVQVLG